MAPARPALRRPLNFAESSATFGSVNVPRLTFNFRLGFAMLRYVQSHSDQTCSNQASGPKIRGSKFNITGVLHEPDIFTRSIQLDDVWQLRLVAHATNDFDAAFSG